MSRSHTYRLYAFTEIMQQYWQTGTPAHLSDGIRRQGHIHTDYMHLLKPCNSIGR